MYSLWIRGYYCGHWARHIPITQPLSPHLQREKSRQLTNASKRHLFFVSGSFQRKSKFLGKKQDSVCTTWSYNGKKILLSLCVPNREQWLLEFWDSR